MAVVVFLAILALLILVHEFGHFLAAKKNGVLVEEFGIGFPPRLFGIKKGDTLYSINALPIGGFVKVYGEEYHEEETKPVDRRLRDRAFVYKKPWQKAVIIASGIVGNFLLAWVLISFLFTQGVPTPTNNVIVERVQSGSPADKAGLLPQDVVTKIILNTKTYQISSSSDLIKLSRDFAGRSITLVYIRNKVEKTAILVPRKEPPQGQGPLGVVITSFVEKKYPWFQAPFFGLAHSFAITYRIVVELSKTLFQLMTLQKPSVDVAGPIGIAQFTSQAIKFGKNAVLELTALLSLNLAVINIFPFPALDGGRLLFVLYEWTTKKRINKRFERYANLFGMIVLLTLAFIISINDIVRLSR
ncbi:site-2 protease family protein [Candidatus Roizmanbacteria bacterium]|nr:site-2 protease family protein [Candidatus Roizmanbacteria bacterium]